MSREPDRRRAVARLALLAVLIAAAFAAVTVAGVGPGDAQRWVAGAGPAAPLLFVLVAATLGVALFPGHVVAAAAGLLFGALGGTAVALGTALLAAALSYFVARRVGSDALLSLLSPRARRWQQWVAEHGFSAVLVSRLAPGVPSGIVNYLAGLAGLRVRALLGAVAIGALPKTIAYVALGGALSDPWSARGLVAVSLYVVAAAGGVLVGRRLLKARPGQLSRA
ncbi:VTT domain-containing protein [Solirubrobacter phytolaccae]|uniref:TVP38/TMEM64 family membrane protein n=1 Tax=Solirubrobacter phytolaccae TaxID=1404360 RepID=A0A9X3N7N2_9ACTN|nr:VTT domain-containing protein [Solirubrobacter phytolaccae]MDA0181253.1 VTT domain-containing protein [Solirubrobacter phytolaccae]